MSDTPPPPLVFRDLKARIEGGYLYIEDSPLDSVTFDMAEAIALRNWLNEVLP
jgi:hypothetical protein